MAAAMATGATIAPTAAYATPNNCSWARYTDTSIVGICTSGTGQYQVKITCQHWFQYPGGTWSFYRTYGYSSVKSIGQHGYAYCPGAGEVFENGGFVIL